MQFSGISQSNAAAYGVANRYGQGVSKPQKPVLRPSQVLEQLQQAKAGAGAASGPIQQTGTIAASPRLLATHLPAAATNPAAPATPTFNQRLAQLNIRDVQHVATRAGFLDVTPEAIHRAYQYQESLLVDYTV